MTLYKRVNKQRIKMSEEEERLTREEWAREEKKTKETEYLDNRMREYPPVEDQFEACFYGFKAMMDSGIDLPAETTDWVKKISSVKNKYKKPTI